MVEIGLAGDQPQQWRDRIEAMTRFATLVHGPTDDWRGHYGRTQDPRLQRALVPIPPAVADALRQGAPPDAAGAGPISA